MSKSGIDSVLRSGNLTMGQVSSMFQRLILETKDQQATETVGRKYGRAVSYSEEDGASNPNLKSAIQNFVNGAEPIPEGARTDLDTAVGDNITLLLIRADNVQNLGEESERAMDSDLSTHWTTLNLRRDNGEIEVLYADSMGYHNGRDEIPEVIKQTLEEFGIDLAISQKDFLSTHQTDANCGYMAVWHALSMHGVEVFANHSEEFVQEQRKILGSAEGQFNGQHHRKNLSATHFTKQQLGSIEEKLKTLAERYPQYDELLSDIVEVILDIDYRNFPTRDSDKISEQGRRFLSKNYNTDFSQAPSFVGFLADNFYAAAITDQNELQKLRGKISGSGVFEERLLENLFLTKELAPDIITMEKALCSLINFEVLRNPPQELGDARLLNQMVFFFGAPFDNVARPTRNIENTIISYYNRMISPNSYAGDILEDLLHNPENLSNSLEDFFNEITAQILLDDSSKDKERVGKICQILKKNCEKFYQNNPSLFVLFKPKFDIKLATEEEIKIMQGAKDESAQGETAFREFKRNRDPNDTSQPPSNLLYFSQAESKAMAVIEKITRSNAEPISQLSLSLLRIYNKQFSIPETRGIFERLPLVNFVSELLSEHYEMGNGYNPYHTGDSQRDKVLGMTMDSFLLKGGKDMFDLQKYAEKLRSEIKELKTTRQINDKVAKYFTSGLHERITNTVENHLKPFHDETAESAPYAMGEVGGNWFHLFQGFEQIIAKTSEIAENFKRRYQEIDEETSAKNKRDEDVETARQAELRERLEREEELERIRAKELKERLEREIAQQKAAYAEMESNKKELKSQPKDNTVISCNDKTLANGKLIELKYQLKGDKSKNDSTYNKDSYRVLISKEIHDLINT